MIETEIAANPTAMSGPIWDAADEAAIELLESDEVPCAAALGQVDSRTLDAIETEIAQLGIDSATMDSCQSPVTVDSCQSPVTMDSSQGTTQALQQESQPADTPAEQASVEQAKQGKPVKRVTSDERMSWC